MTDWLGGNIKDFGLEDWGSIPLTDTMALLTRIHVWPTWSLVEVEQKIVIQEDSLTDYRTIGKHKEYSPIYMGSNIRSKWCTRGTWGNMGMG